MSGSVYGGVWVGLCVFDCACLCVHLRAYALGACARVRARLCACPCTRAFVSDHVRGFVVFQRIASLRACGLDMCVCSERVRAPRRCARTLATRRGPAVYKARPAAHGSSAARACLRLRHRPVSRALAAGVTWTCRTSNAEWEGRAWHTSVIDASGAIYVIGGGGGLSDVWASTDGGA